MQQTSTQKDLTIFGVVLALYVSFEQASFLKRPAVLFTQVVTGLRLYGLLTMIAMMYGRIGDLFVLLSYPEQLQGSTKEFNAQAIEELEGPASSVSAAVKA